MKGKKIGEVLVEKDILTLPEVEFCLSVQGSSWPRERIGNIAVQYALTDQRSVYRALAHQAGWELFEGDYVADMEAFSVLGYDFCSRKMVFPLKEEGRRVFIVGDAEDVSTTDALRVNWGCDPFLYLGIPDELVKAVNSLAEDTSLSRINKDREDPLSLEGARQDVLVLLDEAVRRGASDMHFESSEKAMEVRLRIDGVLHFERSFRREDAGRVVNILFNLAEISAGDFLRFHDARFMYKVQSREVDVRLSHIPSVHGSSIVLRLLERSRAAVPLESLGYAQLQQEVIEKALKRPHGLILLTGPTGCGKTTTLYAMLNRLKGLGVKVVTVEDPVEIRMPLVTQVAADLRKGHDFHQVTRAILRHDPDVILIGEIRDELTAREAVRAAVTGHLVLSTLHTNDAVSAVLRLRDLGIDAGHIANVLLCVAAQRLVRRLCPLCKRKEGETFFPVGCPACLNGFKGRTVVSEILWVEDEARFLIEQGLTHELKAKLKEKTPLLSMEEDSRRALRDGLTSQDEIRRVIG